jgi:hypothetical protein
LYLRNIVAQCTIISVRFSVIQQGQTLKEPTEIRSKEQTYEATVIAVAAVAGLPPLLLTLVSIGSDEMGVWDSKKTSQEIRFELVKKSNKNHRTKLHTWHDTCT